MAALEIRCTQCGAETLLRREPLYEGFRKVGETLACSGCGHRFPDEASVPYITRPPVAIFSEADRPRTPALFSEADKTRNCRHCAHYLKNPFTQWCSRHKRETEALDVCADFKRKPAT